LTNTCQLAHREPRQALDGALVCRHHHGWLRDSIDDIVITYALLPHFYEPGTAVDDGHQVKGKRVDPPAPVRLDVVALLDRRTAYRHPGDIVPVLAILEAWATLVRDERKIQPCRNTTVTSEAGLLLGHLDWIIGEPFVTDFAEEIRQVKSALHSAIGDHAPRPVGTCPVVHPDNDTECGGKLYQDRYGGMSVTCRKCGETWGETELRRLGLMTQAV
jgi:hypothetical protein